MSLQPIIAVNSIIEEYKDFILTEFRAKDEKLKIALEQELDKPGFLAQEPFVQIHRPFKQGKKWSELPLDPKLSNTLKQRAGNDYCYLHQSDSIDYLMQNEAKSLIVTTGTGSGKTECFLLPVIQNALNDSFSFKKSGLTAILVYPMNALANDQLERIEDYLNSSGFSGILRIAKYDRGTSQKEREDLRTNPPHILLTNYMMLEYLLVRPADRDNMFANHRCKFLVLDEVHTYRGALGSNIALLIRRLKTHLKLARQDYLVNTDFERNKRFPNLVLVGTSATIKSDEAGNKDLKDDEIKQFFSRLAGVNKDEIKVLSEELQEISIPKYAKYSDDINSLNNTTNNENESLAKALNSLSGEVNEEDLYAAAKNCRILWDLTSWLIKKPMSLTQIVNKIKTTVPERKNCDESDIKMEVLKALQVGGLLPDDLEISLKIKVHQFFRGGWSFYRCLNPDCGKVYPKGEERCECGSYTAPLYLCRNCGADYLRLVGTGEATELKPSEGKAEGQEWMIYQPEKFMELQDADDELDIPQDELEPVDMISKKVAKKVKGKEILSGSFDFHNLQFSSNANEYSMKVVLSPARSRCLCCGDTAGSRNIISSVRLGTSAALKVLSEATIEALEAAYKDEENSDKKQRILIFSDSRQDAAHQARFIRFASRYDRMRKRLYDILIAKDSTTIQEAINLLSKKGEENKDNPYLPEDGSKWIPEVARDRMKAYEEAPLLDELAVNAGYRATLMNLGLVQVIYHELDEYIKYEGEELISNLGLNPVQFYYLCCALLDKIRMLGCLNRNMLKYHPSNLNCPEYMAAAEWERGVKQPKGFAADKNGEPVSYLASSELPAGIKIHNPWKKLGTGGKEPFLQRIFKHLIQEFNGSEIDENSLVEVLNFLKKGSFLVSSELHGFRDTYKLLQVNHEIIRLKIFNEENRYYCKVCGNTVNYGMAGFPCPFCHGHLTVFKDLEVNNSRYVKRIKSGTLPLIQAAEHTAQITNDDRIDIETKFKSSKDINSLNILACSPTLEMGIDVGGLDAILLRNIPPRPDNYAQRGGRAGRRKRVGLVLGYVRKTPHDQYFYEHPEEMISGEVLAPQLSLYNKDIILRHLNSIIFSLSEPGLAGKMVYYINEMGEIKEEYVNELIDGIKSRVNEALELAKTSWEEDIFSSSGLNDELLKEVINSLPKKIEDVFNRTSRQVKDIRKYLDQYYTVLRGARKAQSAANLVSRILGIEDTKYRQKAEADDRSSGYPLRRFAEFGILPGYEFPSQPASLRLMGDFHEDDLISVERRFGIAQYQPDAQVYARTQRWKVIGVDTSSPWNPYGSEYGIIYRTCNKCGLRFESQEPSCPRCKDSSPGKDINALEYAGFLARKDEAPILDEEERASIRSNVIGYPQWNGDIMGRWSVGEGWGLRLNRGEKIIWLNEGNIAKQAEIKKGLPLLNNENNKGFLICPSCGNILNPKINDTGKSGGRKKPNDNSKDPYKHALNCDRKGIAEEPIALYTENNFETLKLIVPIPKDISDRDLKEWAYSLGYALRLGMRHRYSLDGSEIEFLLEGPWNIEAENSKKYKMVSLTFVDAHIGGSGYLPKIAEEFNKVAEDTIHFLDHDNCVTACYRCLKSYQNQRHHEYLNWLRIIPDLEMIKEVQIKKRPKETGDIDDPKPWLEAYDAGVGSPLELKFLRLFEQFGLQVVKQEPVGTDDISRPISIADFGIREKRIAIYIDGAKFHVGQNLRRDKYIREKLRTGTNPWKVVELRASDLSKGKKLIEEIIS